MLKGVFDIETTLKALGVETLGYTARGRVKAYCPVHPRKENHPRHWSMDVETGMWHCWSCGAGGSLVGLVTDLTDMSVWDAIGWLRSEGLQQITFERPLVEAEEEAKAEERQLAVASTAETWGIFNTPSVEEMRKRNISIDGVLHYDVRWAPGERDNELLLRNEAWAFALLQWDNKFLGYQLKSKKFVKNVPTGVQKDQTFFGIAQFPVGAQAIVVESPLDAVRLWELGYEPLAVMGSFVSVAQLDLLTASTDHVIVAMDYDAAGKAEARRLVTELRGMRTTFMEYRVAERREDGRRPKDVGEMTEPEIHAAIADARFPHECGKLIGPRPERPGRRQSITTRKRRSVRR